MVVAWSCLAEVVLTRPKVEGFVEEESVEEWCLSSRETMAEDGNEIVGARLAEFVDATA
jgi:hypothetical protein